jgi:hypothetical protein
MLAGEDFRATSHPGAITMRRIILLGLALLFSAPARSYDGLTSELGHAMGGMAVAGVTTWAVSDLWPESRGLIGFGAAVLVGVLDELHDKHKGYGFSALDVASSAAGGAIGAFVTDRFILAPVASRSQSGSYVGVVAQYRF